jgi:hypothetical protein
MRRMADGGYLSVEGRCANRSAAHIRDGISMRTAVRQRTRGQRICGRADKIHKSHGIADKSVLAGGFLRRHRELVV